MESELRPCPFCGGAAIEPDDIDVIHAMAGATIYGGCSVCDASGPGHESPSAADAAWNTRPIEDALTARLAAAERERDEAIGEVQRLRGIVARVQRSLSLGICVDSRSTIRADIDLYFEEPTCAIATPAPPRTEEG